MRPSPDRNSQVRPPGLPVPGGEGPDRAVIEPLFNALRRLVHTLHAASRDTERRIGVTGAQLFVLTQLRVSPTLSINALAERTMTHQSTVSVVVQRLVARKLVKKIRSAQDGRRVELTLTPAGIAMLRRAPEVMQQRLASAIARMPPDERSRLTRGISELIASLGGDPNAPANFLFEAMR